MKGEPWSTRRLFSLASSLLRICLRVCTSSRILGKPEADLARMAQLKGPKYSSPQADFISIGVKMSEKAVVAKGEESLTTPTIR